jgi:hypothetical protein
MSVNAACSMMVVSLMHRCEVRVFRIKSGFKEVRRIGRRGKGPVEFIEPRGLCFVNDTDTFLFCDSGNHRVQHLSITGECLNIFSVRWPCSVACRDALIAVSSRDGPVEIRALSTGNLIQRFGTDGDGPGQIGGHATGIRFTPKGDRLLLAEQCNSRLSLFTVDGSFLKHIGVGMLSTCLRNDIEFGAGGEIIVADSRNNCICVFSSDGDTLLKSWGSKGCSPAEFQYPVALAVAGPQLFVMDNTRVQVFV